MDLQSALQWVVKESRDSLEPLTSKDLEGAAIPKCLKTAVKPGTSGWDAPAVESHLSVWAFLAGAGARAESCWLTYTPHNLQGASSCRY